MRICLATTHFAPLPGGIANYYTCLSRLLTDAGHTVILLTIAGDDDPEEDRIDENGLFIKITLSSGYRRYLRKYSAYFRPGGYDAGKWIATGMAMRDWLLKHIAAYQIELIETMDYGGAGIFLKQDGLPPLIIDAHSSALQIDRQYPLLQDDHLAVIKKLETLSFTHADAILAHSPMNLAELKTLGYNQTFFSRAPWQLPGKTTGLSNPHKNRFLVISSLQMIKGAELMIQATAIAGNSMDSLVVYWVGEDSYSAPGGQLTSGYLEEKYPETWNKQLIWLGHKNKEEIAALIKETSAVIIPSLWDTFNYVVPETIYAGTPLILSDKTGASYLIQDYPNVILFEAGNPAALAKIMIHYDPEANKVSTGLFPDHHLENYFSPTAILAERMTVYTTVIRGSTTSSTSESKQALQFLDDYLRPRRKIYYWFRKKIKALIRWDLHKLRHT
jgi:glycosyltransferase involved in cell wall biosynthesis